MSVGVYVRVSTLDQESGLESQVEALKVYLEGEGLKGVKWYQDRPSRATTRRPAFEKLQRDIASGKVKTVVCWKLDRLSRSLRDGITVLCDWLDHGVRVVAVSQQLDFSGTEGQMVAGILFAVAQMERENQRENTKRGLQAAKDRGVKLGKRPKLFVKDIVPLLARGLNIGAVAKTLGKSRQAIYDTLEREGVDVSGLCRTHTT